MSTWTFFIFFWPSALVSIISHDSFYLFLHFLCKYIILQFSYDVRNHISEWVQLIFLTLKLKNQTLNEYYSRIYTNFDWEFIRLKQKCQSDPLNIFFFYGIRFCVFYFFTQVQYVDWRFGKAVDKNNKWWVMIINTSCISVCTVSYGNRFSTAGK